MQRIAPFIPTDSKRKDGKHDRRYAVETRLYFVFEGDQDVASVEASSAIGAIQRAAVHMGVRISEAMKRWTAEEA